MNTDLGKPGLVWLPCQEVMYVECVRALLPVAATAPVGSVVRFESDHCTLAAKRNAAVASLLASPTLKWLLMVDSDMVPPPDVLQRLQRHGEAIVGAVCFQRKPPYAACVHPKGDQRLVLGAGLAEVEAVGTGCLYIRRRAVEGWPHPWFMADKDDVREDIYFCHTARTLGWRVYVDTGCVVGHVHPMAVTDQWPARGLPRAEVAA